MLPKLNLPEIADQPWCPAWVRDAMTGYLHEMFARTRPYHLAAPRLAALLRGSNATRIIDLCSGGGGPWPDLREPLRAAGVDVPVFLTDVHPNAAAALRLSKDGGIEYLRAPVSVTDVPAELHGARTMFTALHHFDAATVRRILLDAQRAGVAFAAFEATSRSWKGVAATLVIPMAVLALMPLVRPRHWAALWLTYLPPLLPLAIWWDGFASMMKTARVEELRAIVSGLPPADYTWSVEEVPGGPLPVLAVLGHPQAAGSGAPPRVPGYSEPVAVK
jgi:hypothetical protein